VLHVNSEVLVHFKNIESPACNIVNVKIFHEYLYETLFEIRSYQLSFKWVEVPGTVPN
jgi:hypothetical protein